jgi:hypothetical protein
MARGSRPSSDNPDTAGKDSGTTASGDGPSGSSPARSDSASRMERAEAYRDKVDAVYRQYAIEHGYAGTERIERETVGPGNGDSYSAYHASEDRPELVDRGMDGGDVPDDPRNHSNPKTGRRDASWSTYDRAMAVARERTGGDLGPDSIKMYDYNPETGEGTGTLIGEQTPDRLRGWRIDGRDGHVNWWDWTGGKKGAGGLYGHDWFPHDGSTPGSRYIGWAPWQDSDGNILEGN